MRVCVRARNRECLVGAKILSVFSIDCKRQYRSRWVADEAGNGDVGDYHMFISMLMVSVCQFASFGLVKRMR